MTLNKQTIEQSKNPLKDIKREILNLEANMVKAKIHKSKSFKEWQNDFKIIYGMEGSNLRLYLTSAIIYFFGLFFLLKNSNLKDKIKNFENFAISEITKIQDELNKLYWNFSLFNFDYFEPISNLSGIEELDHFNELINKLARYINELEIDQTSKLDYVIQNLISELIRHKSGEFYTPPFLVKKMVNECYVFGEKVIDPCCGCGNFLIEILKIILSSKISIDSKISAINKIHGYDINPLSIFITKINFIVLLKDYSSIIQVNLVVRDSLFEIEENEQNFDLIIGNPPWYTYRDVETIEIQEKIKKLAEKLEIKPRPKNILNIELSTLFFYQARDVYMKENAKIFYVMTKGVITGSHASRFRNFNGFKNIKIWTFGKKLEGIFNVDFITIFAQKSKDDSLPSKLEVLAQHYELNAEEDQINYFDDINLEKINDYTLIPYHIEKKANGLFTKKLISKDLVRDLISNKESIYKKLFHKGADLNPRNLIFVKLNQLDDSLVKINPDDRIFKRAKAPWNRVEYKDVILEKKYIFKVLKSTELIKFCIYDFYNVFLPLFKKDLNFNYNELTSKAREFYDHINRIYLNYKKSTTKHNSLMDNLNRWSKLINENQLSRIKVIYNNSGSVLNAAVVNENYLITSDLSFYATNDLNEAYFLSSILNSYILTEQVKIRKSSRHIFKIPFELPIKKYNPANLNHEKLSRLGKKCEDIARMVVSKMIRDEKTRITKPKLQKQLMIRLKPLLSEIDTILQTEIY
ncbi:MAG: hypothetical protein EU539_12320 [Promethearchaeota archaeon]|nr:MAG: hypothetical protein EU539_12320 [Candidatus Lokiarchaeota archaeon]